MEKKIVIDEGGDIVHNEDSTTQKNMIGVLTTLILKHLCGLSKKM